MEEENEPGLELGSMKIARPISNFGAPETTVVYIRIVRK